MILGLTFLDLLLVVLFVSYAISGYRQGLVVSVLSLAGFLAGGAVAMWLVPIAIHEWTSLETTPLLRDGRPHRRGVHPGLHRAGHRGAHRRAASLPDPGQAGAGVRCDPGAVVVVASVAVLVWFIAGALRGGAPAPLARAIGGVAGAAGHRHRGAAPDGARSSPASARCSTGRASPGCSRARGRAHRAGRATDPTVVRTPGVDAAADSVIKITGVAEACNRGQEGSGWVVSPGRVVTNAHVVAGCAPSPCACRARAPPTPAGSSCSTPA